MSNVASVDLHSTRSANRGPERSRTLVFADDRSPGADVAWLWICSQRWDGWNVARHPEPETSETTMAVT